jgi:uncharacterized protein with GYD domain
MPKYLFQVTYTAEGVKGLMKDGGTKRRTVAEGLIRTAGGTMESFYFAFGPADVVTIADVPDAASAAAISLHIGATGAAKVTTIPLMLPEEIDQAAKKRATYTPPGA